MKIRKPNLDVADVVVAIVVIAVVTSIAVQTGGIILYSAVIGGSAFVSALYHYGIRSSLVASLLSAFTVTIFTFVVDAFLGGDINVWLTLAALISGGMAFGISLAVGYVMDRLGLSKRSTKQQIDDS